MLAAGAALAVVAVLAGLTGTWSPCGLSTVETLGTAAGTGAARRTVLMAALGFAVAALAGGVATFGGAALIGSGLGFGGRAAPAALAAAVAVGCALGDWRFARVVPQIPRQVPERVRWRLPLPATGLLYGWLLGLGFTTYLLSYAMWALLAGALLLGSPAVGVAVGLAFGAGRALPVLGLVPSYGAPATQAFLADMAQRPLLAGLRRVAGMALAVAAILVVPVAVAAAASTPPAPAADPSASGSDLVYMRDGAGMLRRAGRIVALPGAHPAVGGRWIVWQNADTVTLALRARLLTVVTFTLPRVDALAVGARWIAYRTTARSGEQAIGAARLLSSGHPIRFYAPRKRSVRISRPSVWGDHVAFAVSGRRGSRIVLVDLRNGRHRTVRSAGHGAQLGGASLRDGRLLYVRTTRCVQELRLGRVHASAHRDRVLLRMRSTADRDPGYQRGYVRAYNGASLCHVHHARRLSGSMWTTALAARAAYVTRLYAGPRREPKITAVALKRGG